MSFFVRLHCAASAAAAASVVRRTKHLSRVVFLLGVCAAAVRLSPDRCRSSAAAESGEVGKLIAAAESGAADPLGPTNHRRRIAELAAGAPAQSAWDRAVERLLRLHAVFDYDAQGHVALIDLSADRTSAADADLDTLRAFPKLRRLRLAGAGITNAALPEILRLKELEELWLRSTQINDDGAAQLAELPRLASLNIDRAVHLTDRAAEHFQKFPSLIRLQLVDNDLSDAALEPITRLSRLVLLDLRRSPRITREGLKRVGRLANLRALRISGDAADDQIAETIAGLKKLESLTIEDAPITPAGLRRLLALPLVELNLARCFSLDDDAAAAIGQGAALRRISLRDLPIGPEGLKHLAGCRRLESLKLDGVIADDDSLVALAKLPLTTLEVRNTVLASGGVEAAARIASLETLALDDCRLTSAAIAPLAQAKKLKSLSLAENQEIGDEAVATLSAIKGLKSLQLRQTGLSREGLRRLAAALPDCAITASE